MQSRTVRGFRDRVHKNEFIGSVSLMTLDVLFRNVSRSGGACAERKTCQCRTTFHSLRLLVIRYQHEPGILQDCRLTSKKLTGNNEVYNLLETKEKIGRAFLARFGMV